MSHLQTQLNTYWKLHLTDYSVQILHFRVSIFRVQLFK